MPFSLRAQSRNSAFLFSSHSFCQNLITWPHQVSSKAEKYFYNFILCPTCPLKIPLSRENRYQNDSQLQIRDKSNVSITEYLLFARHSASKESPYSIFIQKPKFPSPNSRHYHVAIFPLIKKLRCKRLSRFVTMQLAGVGFRSRHSYPRAESQE